MPTVDVVDLNNEKVGELELADAVFGAEVNDALLYEAVRHYQACERAGTHKTKVRREVAGSGKKLSLELGGKSPFVVFEDAALRCARAPRPPRRAGLFRAPVASCGSRREPAARV